MKLTLEELYKDLEGFKSEAQEIEDRLKQITNEEANGCDTEEDPDLEETKKALKKKLSALLFKCAITEGVICRAEDERKKST